MVCPWCGGPTGWRCAGCGRFSMSTWLALLGGLAWSSALVAGAFYLWKLVPTVAALLSGLDRELEPVTRLHIGASNAVVRYGLVLFVPAAFAWWIRRHGPAAAHALAAFALTGVVALAFTLVAMGGALYSVVVHIPPILRIQVAANECAAVEALRRAVRAGAPITCQPVPADFGGTRNGYEHGCSTGAYWARPADPGRTGIRGFAADASGRICASTNGSVPGMTPDCAEVR